MDIDGFEAGRDDEELQRVGMDRPHVRDVANVALEERDPAGWIDRLEHDAPARANLVERKGEQLVQILRLEVLDDLDRDQPAQ